MELNQGVPLPDAWVEKLFHKMLLEYGKKFTDQWGMVDTQDMISHWARELSGYSGAEIRKGVEALSTKPWPPALPEFKAMCRPPVEPVRAYYEAVAGVQARFSGEAGEWSHPAIYWAAMPMAIELKEQSFSAVRARWEASLAAQLAHANWDPIPAPVVMLAAPETKATSNDRAQEAIKDVASKMVNKPVNYNYKWWAQNLLDRAKSGEKLLPIQVQFARQALGAEE